MKEEELWEALSVSRTGRTESRSTDLDNLIQRAKKIISQESETKLKHLRKSLVELSGKFSDLRDQKILVFTESRDTLDYLERKLIEWATQSPPSRRDETGGQNSRGKHIQERETDNGGYRARRGNKPAVLPHDDKLRHPWNPNRLKQRWEESTGTARQRGLCVQHGREDTREGMVLKRLFDNWTRSAAPWERQGLRCPQRGILRQDFPQMLTEAAANARNIDEIIAEMDIRVDHEEQRAERPSSETASQAVS
jgi:hypothetical protein